MTAVVNYGNPSEIKAKFDAEEENIRDLERIRDNIEASMIVELDLIMEKVKIEAISLCPCDSGALRSSIEIDKGVVSSQDFAGYTIGAGDPSIVNNRGVPTSQYAEAVHDGHTMPDGSFWEGVPFLVLAMMTYEGELEDAVNRALSELGATY